MQYIPLVVSRGAVPPIAGNNLRSIPPPTAPPIIVSTVRPICMGANVQKSATTEQSVELWCHPSLSVRIWKRWLDIKVEVTGLIFEVPARLAHLPDLSQPDTRTIAYDYVPPALGRWRALGR
jgi:hypothetical protein